MMRKTKQTTLGSFGAKYKRPPQSPKRSSRPSKSKPKSSTPTIRPTSRQITYAERIGIKNPKDFDKRTLGFGIHIHQHKYRERVGNRKVNQKLKEIGIEHDSKGVYSP